MYSSRILHNFQLKLGTLLGKVDAFEMKLYIFQINLSVFRLNLRLAEQVRITFLSKEIYCDFFEIF